MRRSINPITLGFDYKLVPYQVNLTIPLVLVEFSKEGSASLDAFSPRANTDFTVSAAEVLLTGAFEATSQITLNGDMITFEQSLFGSGTLLGPGKIV